ncbi:MAG: hypothetical protein QM218_06325 [Candidatus Cloacimonadota bacterium]|jgi:hypothetical protein|nr:hypothetical protein [Candidatus Cloacimonadota bacterium]
MHYGLRKYCSHSGDVYRVRQNLFPQALLPYSENPKAAPLNSPKGGNTKTQKYLRFSFFALLKHIFQNNT